MNLLASRARLRAAACVCLLLCAQPSPAQDLDDVTFSGTVRDQHGALVPGASVAAVAATTGSARSVVTDSEGRFRLVELAPGAYTLRVAARGFTPEERRGVFTLAGQHVRLDFALRPAGPADEVLTVSATEAPALDATRVVAGGAVAREELERLPSWSRSALDFVFALGGVSEEPLTTRDAAEDRDPRGGTQRAAETPEESGLFSLAGGPAFSNNVTVDGLDNNDDRAARERFLPPLDAVEEVQVVTSQFSAEYGRASGGRVNLRTRAGANELRGRAFYHFKDEALNANTWNNNRRGLKRLPLQEHNPGFSLGGPAGFQGAFFFVAYEHTSQLDTALIDALVPVEQNPAFLLPAPTTLAGRRFETSSTPPRDAAELAPFVRLVSTPARAHALTARLDHTFTDTHNATLLLQLGRSHNLRQFAGGQRLADALAGRARHTDALAYTDNFVITPTVVNQLRAQFSTLRPSQRTRANGPVVLIEIDDPLDEHSGTLVAGSSTSGATERSETRLQLQNTLTVARGPHTLKLGADLQRVRSTFQDLTDATGTYTFTSAGDFLAGAPARFRQRFRTESVQRNAYAGLFFQHEWRTTPRLTLSFGLRHERETILRDRDNFGPRAGLAFDPTGSGRTVLRAGFGVFYNRVLLRTVDDFAVGSGRVVFDTNALTDPSTGRALTDPQRRAFIAARLRFPSTLSPDSPLVRDFGSQPTNFARQLDPALRIPESYQANVGLERELARGLIVEANYTFNRGLHLWRETNVNAPRLPAGFADFTAYLLSRDFSNFRDAAGARPLHDAQTAGDLVRFTLAPPDADALVRVVESGVPVSVFNLASVNSTSALEAALAALQPLRPDPSRTQVEQLVSAGNSFYHGLTLEARFRPTPRAAGWRASLRTAYTLSRLTDDGVVNTSSALRPGDFRGERAPSLLDRRHRLALSSTLDAPPRLASLRLAAVLRLATAAPFNLSLGGVDRNLDDVSNDRPDFDADPRLLRWRRPGAPSDPRLLEALSLPAIGRTGGLPRNAGRGPGLFALDLSLSREFKLSEHARLRPTVEFDNVLNKTVFTFGAEFVNFDALRPDATPAQRRAFLDTFLVPSRTLRPRAARVGLKFDF
jgi:hypothetical protein